MPELLIDDRWCYACGERNPRGLALRFDRPEKGRLTAEVVFSKEHQGFKGIVHGGMLALVLDEMMVNLAWKEGIPAVTAEFTVRLKKPARIGERIRLEGHLDGPSASKKLLRARAEARDSRGELLATATATCFRMPQDSIVLEAAPESS